MGNSITRRILAALLSITVLIFILSPIFTKITIPVASAAGAPPTITINNIQDYVNALPTISGTSTDTAPGTINKVQVQITNQNNNTYWVGNAWQTQLNIQTVDSTGIVGEYTSQALDSSGNPAISYYDDTNGNLKFARWNGSSWVLQTVDSAGDVGYYTSLAFDGSGNPSISYLNLTNSDLKYARWNGSSWVLQTVDSVLYVGWFTSLDFDTSGNPAISYYDYTNKDLKYARWNGSSWVLQTVDSTGDVGQYTSLAFDTSGNPAISYYDYTNKDLKLARSNGSGWVLQTIDFLGDVGYYSSLAFGESGNPSISYYDATNGNLKFAGWNSTNWVLQIVDSAGAVGYYPSLVFDSSNNPAISYYDVTNKDLKFARWDGSSWVLQTVDSTGDLGQYTSLAFDGSGNPAISYYDSTNGNLKFAGLNGSWNDVSGKAIWSYTMPLLTDGNSYKITVRAIDNSGNLLASAVEYFTFYSTAPTVTLSSTAISPTRITPIPVTATFNRAVNGFEIGDIMVGNGTASNFVAVSSTVYTFDITPITQGVVTINVAAGVAQDAMLNNNTAAMQFTITYDTTVPPVNQDQSEYMIGSVTVAVIFPESNGSIDASTENWSKSRMDTCINEIIDGLNWWKNLEPKANLNFTILNYYDKPTSYEPINRPHTDQNLWISEILTGIGYTSGSYTQKVKDFNNYIRNYYKTDWVFTIFVVDSLNDPDGEFTDESIAYAYLGGPFIVMTYDNSSYGINNMDKVAAHETGHIFYATDEYNNEAEYSGYLNILDNDNTTCIMNHNDWNACTATIGQIGWKDSDADGILDPVDTFPDTIINSYTLNITSNTFTVTYTGTSQDIPLTNNNPNGPKHNLTINTIKAVQYRIDNGSWLNVGSTDGAFDTKVEAFSFTTSSLSTDTHTIEVRTQNSVGNWETTYAQKTIIVNPVTIITTGLLSSNPVTIRYTENGLPKTVTTYGTWTGNPDINSTLTIDKTMVVTANVHIITTPDVVSWVVTGSETHTVNYYRQVTPTIVISNKVYDGTTAATIATRSLIGVASGDTVNLIGGIATFDNKNIGIGKTVIATDLNLSGIDAGKYILSSTTVTTKADITVKALTISGITVNNKTYDGNVTASLNSGNAVLVGVVAADIVTLGTGSASGAFADKVVGNGKTVNVSGMTISGADAGNYSLVQPTITADITAKVLTVSGITANNKKYDGNINTLLNTGSATLVGVEPGDIVTLGTGSAAGAFVDEVVANGKTVYVSGLTITGTDAGNYSLIQPTTTANITPKNWCGSTKNGDLILFIGVVGYIVVVRNRRRRK